MKKNDLLVELIEITTTCIDEVNQLTTYSVEVLNHKIHSEKWSMLECIEHLNCYGRFYLPELQKRILTAAPCKVNQDIITSWLGNYFINSVKPNEKPMKTFAAMNPAGSQLDRVVLTDFLAQQNELLEILKQAETIDVNKTKTAISITKWIKLSFATTLQVVIWHNLRHVKQATTLLF